MLALRLARAGVRNRGSPALEQGARAGIRQFHASRVAFLRIGDVAPDFTADTTKGQIKFHDWLGDKWGVLFSHPKDYTPVCTTELSMVQKRIGDFAKRNVKVIALSVDSVKDHHGWIEDIKETMGVTAVDYPIIADEHREVATKYDMLPNAEGTGMPTTVRSVYVIGPDKAIKLMITYPASTGRNFDEIIRVIDSLQLTAYQKLATPVDWRPGDECVIIPTVGDEEAKKLFPQGFRTLKPYFRMVKPNQA